MCPAYSGNSIESRLTYEREASGAAAGIDFLGAGAIIKFRGQQAIRGLTTAAGIWLTCAIGVAADMGLEATAVLSTLFALLIFSLVRFTHK